LHSQACLGTNLNRPDSPDTFVIGTDGIIDFAYVNPDYKVRVDPSVLLAAAKAALP
jgi:hypothetical protein